MENKIQELTDKIYHEGIEKSQQEGAKIVEAAQIQAAAILEKARKEAEMMLADAQKQSDATLQKTKADLRLFGAQSVAALEAEVIDLIKTKVVADQVDEAFADQKFMQTLILKMAEKWAAKEDIVLSVDDADALQKFFDKQAKGLLNKGVKIEQVNGLKSAFSIAPSDGFYKVNFGKEEFANYFKAFLRPQLVEMLFGDQ